ncbi:MAG: 4Fe-4S ferredoxin [Desulfobulbaceae bacterium]|jgi:NAD-dependent dihydropyrimidine dehydrogenase PreA subunit|nr:4Fe-4S ferredoxin [Desulfobulbaceae bacterium]
MKQLRKIIEIDEERCDGCGQCLPNCAEGSLTIVDGKARLVAEHLCDGLGACLGVCPRGALTIRERQADEFDETAVEAHLKNRAAEPSPTRPSVAFPEALGAGCAADGSALHNWPVKLRLRPPLAPFLGDAKLLIAADCGPVVCRDFHEKYLDGRVIVTACPKFEDKEAMRLRLTEIFRGDALKNILLVIIDVPCCSAFIGIAREAARDAACALELKVVTISRQGAEVATGPR